MHRRAPFHLFATLMLLQCSLFSYSTPESVHLIIDAGSSGTRFCAYEVQVADGCINETPDLQCFVAGAEKGLADQSDAEIRATLHAGFARLQGVQIQRAVLLGTGGFRKLATWQQKRQMEFIKNDLAEYTPNATAEVISGEMEGRLSWLSMRSILRSDNHSILETGGATIQWADGSGTALSIPAGLNDFHILSGPPASCRDDAIPEKDRFARCAEGLQRTLRSQKWYSQFFASHDKGTVYVLGSAWRSIFSIRGDHRITIDELKDQGSRVCASSLDAVNAMGVPSKFSARSCYLHAYQWTLLSELQITEVHMGNGSWPPGAAVSPDYFAECALPENL